MVAWWPAYYIEAALLLDHRGRERFKVVDLDTVYGFICNNDVVVVLEPWIQIIQRYDIHDQLALCGYAPIEEINGTSLLTRAPPQPRRETGLSS